MSPETLTIKAAIQIIKPVAEVFEAIVNPDKMSNYFISKSTGRMESGVQVTWQFPEFDMKVPVQVDKVEKDSLVTFFWGEEGKEQKVEISLSHIEDNATLVNITEGTMPNDEAGIKWLVGNTEGWANFLACLKAYMEYGINLRKGAFDFMAKKA
jgi:uncharacterized protein YndB with AHSA1/START domain